MDESIGSWITLQFGQTVVINTMKYANRDGNKNKGVDLTFSNGIIASVELKDDHTLNSFPFPMIVTFFVNVLSDVCNIVVENAHTTCNQMTPSGR